MNVDNGLDPRLGFQIPNRNRNGVPQFVKALIALALAGLILVSTVSLQISNYQQAQQDRVCERQVAARDDNRAMWLYALDITKPKSEAEKERLRIFTIELDKRLPVLHCVNGEPIPHREK